MELCDRNCNECPIVMHPNSRIVTYVLNKMLNEFGDEFGDEVNKILNDTCPNLTVCPDCRIDDFCHVEGCEIIKKLEAE